MSSALAALPQEDGLEDLPPANQGAFEGGATGTKEDTREQFPFSEDEVDSEDIPTGIAPSPLFGARSFTQKLLRFEEFGTVPLPTTFRAGLPLPAPTDPSLGPDGVALDRFLAQPLFPAPTRLATIGTRTPGARPSRASSAGRW